MVRTRVNWEGVGVGVRETCAAAWLACSVLALICARGPSEAAAQYPTCPAIESAVVCGGEPMFTDTYRQRETSIAMVTDDCNARLLAIWIDAGQYVHPGVEHIGLSIGDVGDLPGDVCWHAPGSDTPDCPWPALPRRFFNDCYFAGCPWPPPPPDPVVCSALPVTCDGITIDVDEWNGTEPNVCAGGNGLLYAAARLGETGGVGLGFTRSADLGATFGPFDVDRRLGHLCYGSTDYDRLDLAASPLETSDRLYLFWNDAPMNEVWALSLDDAGDTFTALDQLDSNDNPKRELSAPAGVVDDQGTLFVVWTDEARQGWPLRAHLCARRRLEGGTWIPPLEDNPATITPDFDAYNCRPCVSVAVDTSSSSEYKGYVYVVYAAADETSINFVGTTDGGEHWSEPAPVNTYTGRRQWYPEVRVDGRGNVGVSWYDSRNALPVSPEGYDMYMAYSTDGGGSWVEQRVSRAYDPGATAFFDPNLEDPLCPPSDYGGMAADQRSGMSGFYILAMGCAPGVTDVQALFPYEVYLRATGDYDGDFDLDGKDACWNTCLGNIPYCMYAPCICRVMDFDNDCDVDWDDIAAFQNAVTGPLPGCHGVCDLNTDPPPGDAPGGWTAEEVATMPAGCEFAAWYATQASRETVLAFTARLLELMDQSPELFEEPRSYQFLECIYPILDATPPGGG